MQASCVFCFLRDPSEISLGEYEIVEKLYRGLYGDIYLMANADRTRKFIMKRFANKVGAYMKSGF